ncbi:predicted protein [Chaetoceros tenuissimus]|uniref:Uncharacterized protein n=1 Tax=Chaetoceros tenuissimus TaxID=426638 RepID=A0AAD3CUX9_9STRA|nr:predicted protein [Chaetoceros tenuissimus]
MHYVLLLNSAIGASEEEVQLPKKGSLRGSDKNNGEKEVWKIATRKDLTKFQMKNVRRKLLGEQHEDVETPDEEGEYDDMDNVATIDETFFGGEIDLNEDDIFYGPRYIDDEYYKVDDDNFDCDDALDHQEYYEFIEEKLENKKDPSRTQQEDTNTI